MSISCGLKNNYFFTWFCFSFKSYLLHLLEVEARPLYVVWPWGGAVALVGAAVAGGLLRLLPHLPLHHPLGGEGAQLHHTRPPGARPGPGEREEEGKEEVEEETASFRGELHGGQT